MLTSLASTPIQGILHFLGAGLAILVMAGTISSIIYQRVLYRRIYSRAYDPAYRPFCTIILPCKGVPNDLECNLDAYSALDYDSYEVLISVESMADPAVEIISRITDRHPHVSRVVAGYTMMCAQKNHNILAAIRSARNPEIYVFADADIAPEKNWLRELVIPLSDKRLTATTGFRWLISGKHTIGHIVHANVNSFILVLFGFVSLFRIGSICWGGAMAIRKKDFDDLKVAEKWARSAVDDISLAHVLARNNRRSLLIPPCITRTNDSIESTHEAISWTTRQIMFLKAYHKKLWALGLGSLWLAALLLYVWIPWSLFRWWTTDRTFLAIGGWAPLIFLAGDTVAASLYRIMGPIPAPGRTLALQPLLRFTHIVSFWKTLFSRSIIWSGIRYTMAFSGDVTGVERLENIDT